MFEESSEKEVSRGEKLAPKPRTAAPFAWKSLPVSDLIRFRDEITSCLPPLTIDQMNLEEELLLQFHTLRALQADVLDDEDIALNQRVQLANSVQSALNKLLDRQSEVYSQERFKAMEALMIRVLTKLPETQAQEFIEMYEKMLEALK